MVRALIEGAMKTVKLGERRDRKMARRLSYTNRWAYATDLKRRMWRSRWRVGWCETSAWLLAY
jgi:hypothetical protein